MESGGETDPLNAVGDSGTSLGPYQITRGYYDDAVQQNPSLLDDDRSYSNVRGEGSEVYSEMVIQAYMDRYANENRLGRPATDEDIARIHNGGPNGYNVTAHWNIGIRFNPTWTIPDGKSVDTTLACFHVHILVAISSVHALLVCTVASY